MYNVAGNSLSIYERNGQEMYREHRSLLLIIFSEGIMYEVEKDLELIKKYSRIGLKKLSVGT
ncbi:hypothetical protein GCM10020331_070450 [Ectobacillus funiculus]